MFISNLESTGNHKAWKLSSETRNVSAFVSYPLWAKPNAPVTLVFQEQNITTLHKEKTTKRRQLVWTFWSGSSCVGSTIFLEFSGNISFAKPLHSVKTLPSSKTTFSTFHSVKKLLIHLCDGSFFLRTSIFQHLLGYEINFIVGKLLNKCGEIYYCNALLATISQPSDLLA